MSGKIDKAFKDMTSSQLKGVLVAFNKMIKKEVFKGVHKKKRAELEKILKGENSKLSNPKITYRGFSRDDNKHHFMLRNKQESSIHKVASKAKKEPKKTEPKKKTKKKKK